MPFVYMPVSNDSGLLQQITSLPSIALPKPWTGLSLTLHSIRKVLPTCRSSTGTLQKPKATKSNEEKPPNQQKQTSLKRVAPPSLSSHLFHLVLCPPCHVKDQMFVMSTGVWFCCFCLFSCFFTDLHSIRFSSSLEFPVVDRPCRTRSAMQEKKTRVASWFLCFAL